MTTKHSAIRTSALLALLLLAACGKAPAPAAAKASAADAIPVEVARPELASNVKLIHATGTLSANTETRLSFKTGGILKRVLVDTGQSVRAGQLLAQLDLTEVSAGAAQMREGLAKAERDYARAESLFKQDVIAKAQLDDARTALAVARAGSQAMNFNADTGRIVAVADGVVLRRFAESGEVMAPGAPVLAVSQSGGKKVLKVSLSDVDAVRVNLNDAASVQFDALPGKTIAARVLTLAGSANVGTGLFDIELELEGDTGRLSSGAIGQASITPSDSAGGDAGALSVPLAALVEANAERGLLFIVEQNTARARHVTLGEIRGEAVLVTAGLEATMSVVVRGAPYLDDGAPVLLSPVQLSAPLALNVATSAVTLP
jgi:RND family efflux transporter MFP subunit